MCWLRCRIFFWERVNFRTGGLVLQYDTASLLNILLPSDSLQGWFQLNLFKMYWFPACRHKWFKDTYIFTEQNVLKGTYYCYNFSLFSFINVPNCFYYLKLLSSALKVLGIHSEIKSFLMQMFKMLFSYQNCPFLCHDDTQWCLVY